ncbi:MAG: hypothetical protein HY364_04400 [Candidatus Aenigmarchaeota archaeon]|nr:hypothetical protein [Candidatus Aenigmarchaeota archaeon]
MKKGITPVIAIILLLLITIAVIGFATGFFQSIVTTSGQQAQDASQQTGDRVQQIIEFVTSSVDSITVKNAGTKDIDTTKLSFLLAGSPVTCNPPLSGSISPGQTATCVIGTTAGNDCTALAAITVSAPGNTVTGACPSA